MITRKIIGLDMGSCEAAAAAPVFENGRVRSITNLKLNSSKETVIPAEIQYNGELFHYFKRSPRHFDEKIGESGVLRRDVLSALFKELIDNIKKYNEEIGENDNILLLVGCPSSPEWTLEENRRLYEELIQNATGIDKVRVVPESRAAMFGALGTSKGRKISAANGAAVFDFGSSTADFTYMQSGVGQLEFSWNLGACEIEKALAGLLCENARQAAADAETRINGANNFAELESMMRRGKEDYFNGRLTPQTCDQVYKFETVSGRWVRGEISLDEETMERIIQEKKLLITNSKNDNKEENWKGCWKNLCREFFKQAETFLSVNQKPVENIVLTGGASKMNFIKDYADEIFPDKTIVLSPTPECSVSNGLVWVAVADELQEECAARVKARILGDARCSLASLKQSLSSALKALYYQVVMDELESWKDSPEDLALNELVGKMEKRFADEDFTNELKKNQDEKISLWNSQIRAVLEEEVNLQAAYVLGNVGEKLIVPNSMWDKMGKNVLNVALDTEKIAGSIDVASIGNKAAQTAIVCACTVMGVVIGSFFGPIGTGLGYLAGVIAGEIGSEMVKDEDMAKARSAKVRAKVYEDMKKNKNRASIEGQVTEAVNAAFDSVMSQPDFERNISYASEIAFEIVTLRRFEV